MRRKSKKKSTLQINLCDPQLRNSYSRKYRVECLSEIYCQEKIMCRDRRKRRRGGVNEGRRKEKSLYQEESGSDVAL